MQLEQKLRDVLQRDAAELVPVGPGPEDARRRAFRRKRRMQSGVVVVSAAGLVGGSLARDRNPLVGTRHRGSRRSPSTPTSDLAWRTVDGTVLYRRRTALHDRERRDVRAVDRARNAGRS